jgi:MerR family copper efflux transcriptional regulator
MRHGYRRRSRSLIIEALHDKLYQGLRTMPPSSNLCEYLTVKLAAEFLGVCPSTLRNWDRSGKLEPHRHPMNGYRLYRRTELEAVLRSAARRRRDDG